MIKEYLLSNKNIAGMFISSAIIVLALFGIIKHFWFITACIGYVFGVSIAKNKKENITTVSLSKKYQDIFYEYQNFINNNSNSFNKNIRNTITEINSIIYDFTKFLEKTPDFSVDEDSIQLQFIFKDYLPSLINQYNKLPSNYATTHQNEYGNTPEQVLSEQLITIRDTVKAITYSVYNEDNQKLIEQADFIKSTFKIKENHKVRI